MNNVQGHCSPVVLEGNILVSKDSLLRMISVVFRVCFFTVVFLSWLFSWQWKYIFWHLYTKFSIAGQKSILPKFQHKGNRPQFPKITTFLLLETIVSFILHFFGNGDMNYCLSFFQYILSKVRTDITNIIQH